LVGNISWSLHGFFPLIPLQIPWVKGLNFGFSLS
jgi:hypothetical protein